MFEFVPQQSEPRHWWFQALMGSRGPFFASFPAPPLVFPSTNGIRGNLIGSRNFKQRSYWVSSISSQSCMRWEAITLTNHMRRLHSTRNSALLFFFYFFFYSPASESLVCSAIPGFEWNIDPAFIICGNRSPASAKVRLARVHLSRYTEKTLASFDCRASLRAL